VQIHYYFGNIYFVYDMKVDDDQTTSNNGAVMKHRNRKYGNEPE